MQWLLSVPDDFSLSEALHCSRTFLYPPARLGGLGDRLERIEQLSTHTVTTLTIYQTASGLFIRSSETLVGPEIEEVSARVWRMLRLSEDLRPLESQLRHVQGHNIPLRCVGARLIRGMTLWEDIIVSALVRWRPNGSLDLALVRTLVDCAGEPLPQNPTRHAFPDQECVIERATDLKLALGQQKAMQTITIARAWLAEPERWHSCPDRPLATSELARFLQTEFDLNPRAVSFLLARLGRYDFIPDELVALLPLDSRRSPQENPTASELKDFLDSCLPWAGLVYWLVDWNRIAASDNVLVPPATLS